MKKQFYSTKTIWIRLFFAGSLLLVSCSKDNETLPEKEFIVRPTLESSSPYVTELFEFLPAPGQFINKNPGNLASAEGILGKSGLVSLGAWGGSITLGFDHTVMNDPEQEDLIIYGNASPTLAEPGIIYVMHDENGNGKPDDTWYEIAGSEFEKDNYIRNYSVTYSRPVEGTADIPWKDNQGQEGVVKANNFHKQPYYPEWIEEDSYTLTGSLLPLTTIDMSNPTNITSSPLEYGYADNNPKGDKININDAVDVRGKKVNLKGIDFIKIQTGMQANMGWLGEFSTEIRSIADLSLLEEVK